MDITILKDTVTPEGIRTVYAQPDRAVCTRQIGVAVVDDTIKEVAFMGGCSGNTQGVAALISGMKVSEAISRLRGINCGGKGTSCPDQLSKVLDYISGK